MSKHRYIVLDKEEVFVLYYEGKPLTAQKSRWNDWTPPKKIYYSRGAAKSGLTHLLHTLEWKGNTIFDKDKFSIVRYVPDTGS